MLVIVRVSHNTQITTGSSLYGSAIGVALLVGDVVSVVVDWKNGERAP